MTKRKPLESGDVHPSRVLRDEFGMNAENRPSVHLVATEVPEDLRDLIPIVERWAISCDVTRGDYFARQSDSDIAKFYESVLPMVDRINSWLDGMPKDVVEWPDAAVHFMDMLKSHSDAYQPTDEETEAGKKHWQETVTNYHKTEAVIAADTAFSARDYAEVVRLLTPFAKLLDGMHTKKLEMSRRRTADGG